jgi:hypothetical protein
VQQYDKAAIRRTDLGKIDTLSSGPLSFVLAVSPPCRRAVTGIASRPAMNDCVVCRRYQFINLCRRRFTLLEVRLYGGEWNSCEHEDCALELGRTFATECTPRKARQAGLEPLRLVAHAAFESGWPLSLHEIVTAVEQQ